MSVYVDIYKVLLIPQEMYRKLSKHWTFAINIFNTLKDVQFEFKISGTQVKNQSRFDFPKCKFWVFDQKFIKTYLVNVNNQF